MIVYAVSSGSYSDYQIDVIFSTKEKAEAYIRHFETKGGSQEPEPSDKDLEEYELDKPPEPLASSWAVLIEENGEVAKSFIGHPIEYWRNDPPRPAEITIFPGQPNSRRFAGYGETVEHARRSAEELRRQTLALEGKVVTG